MKKITFFVLFVCICVALISCNRIEQYEERATNEETTLDNALLNLGQSQSGDLPSLYAYSFDEYQKILKANAAANFLSDKFVTYDELSMFGEFYGIVFLHDISYETEFYRYMYSFGDDQSRVNLTIYEKHPKSSIVTELITDINKSDMRNSENEIKGKYTANGFSYTYIQGKLSSISWENEGITYILSTSGEVRLNEYALRENDIISALLTSQYDDLAEIAIFKDAVAEK